ncbi:SprT family zinc-dependent metalloprotease [Thiomonas sp.]|jgi:predicted metal-dependent hydrolase|uniref:M48 family metallopeptidase n=1 Tax=Thiomonas sp. TaxID=2047785 RepID=UPI00260F32C8|nr:SprT family zinc-dependent metalloprotease [Thiomonas sp.]
MRRAEPPRSDPRQGSLFGFDPPLPIAPPPPCPAPAAPPASKLPLSPRTAAAGPSHAAPEPKPPAPRRYDDGRHRFDWVLHRAQRRTLALRVDDRGVSLLAPRLASQAAIDTFLRQHAGWVQRKLQQRAQRLELLRAARIDWRDGASLPYLGGRLTLRLRGAAALHWDAAAAELHLPLPAGADAQQVRDAVAAWMQRQALQHFTARVAQFASRLGVRVSVVKLSAATTRWGSAKSDGSIRLHWRLLHFSPQLIDYVIAHEVAHLREMNHSPRFWAHVGVLYPDYREARRQLRAVTLPPWD